MSGGFKQQRFDLERFDGNRKEFLDALRVATERVLDCSRLKTSELHLKVMITTVANLSTIQVTDLEQESLRPVDWSEAEWERELRCGRSTLYKVLAVAKAAEILTGSLGSLVINKSGIRRWLTGDLPTSATRDNIDRARGVSPRDGLTPQSVKRTGESVSRTLESVLRTDTYILTKHSTDTVPVQSDSPSHGLAIPGSGAGAGTGSVTDSESVSVLLGDDWPECVLYQPEIADALHRVVDPLAPEDCIRGAFTPLTDRDMGCCKSMTVWFRRQLALPDPVTGATEAHLLVVIAIALYAARMPVTEVRRNRVAVFVNTLKRRDLRRCLKYLPQARQNLDRLIDETSGRCLSIPKRLTPDAEPLAVEG